MNLKEIKKLYEDYRLEVTQSNFEKTYMQVFKRSNNSCKIFLEKSFITVNMLNQ